MRWYGAIFTIIVLLDGLWFFGFALPRHPAPSRPPVPTWSATREEEQMYIAALEQAGTKDWDRLRIVDTAMVIPGLALICTGLGVLFHRAGRSENID
ncbi:MAG TPA: hypothetical protein VFE17_05095 [Candidatus Baltobacteraceae bacterium]|jgi:hypothetical protein|nr:hypothetical protein [Candidatus Baltobacteraceae bacterium]